jgi:D-aminopeptidase
MKVYIQTVHAEMAELVPGSRRLDGRSIEFTGPEMPLVYRAWCAMVDLSILGE